MTNLTTTPLGMEEGRRQVPKWRFKRAAAMVATALSLLGSLILAVPAAEAATANAGVYVVTPAWWGHCTYFGGVNGLATVNSYVGHSNRGDFGNDIAWVPVRLNTSQSVQIKTHCRRYGWAVGTSMSISIRPSRNGQTFFVGADSRYWSN